MCLNLIVGNMKVKEGNSKNKLSKRTEHTIRTTDSQNTERASHSKIKILSKFNFKMKKTRKCKYFIIFTFTKPTFIGVSCKHHLIKTIEMLNAK